LKCIERLVSLLFAFIGLKTLASISNGSCFVSISLAVDLAVVEYSKVTPNLLNNCKTVDFTWHLG